MFRKIIISRTDSIGDVILTLPLAGLMKEQYPGVTIYFLGRTYTQPVVDACEHIDKFIDWDKLSVLEEKQQMDYIRSLQCDAIVHIFPDYRIAKLAYQSKIPNRIGTSHRFYHWLFCNRWVWLGRKNSQLHEAQLNLELLKFSDQGKKYPLHKIWEWYGLTKIPPIPDSLRELIDPQRFNLILHPKSKGSAREWGLDNFGALISLLPAGKYKIFISGVAEDKKQLYPWLENYRDKVTDISGMMTLPEFIAFINEADGLVAASTGPLHIAAALGKTAIGIFAPMHPIHPGRWSPVGKNAHFLVLDKTCSKCRKNNDCECIRSISPRQVADILGHFSGKQNQKE